MRPNSVATGAGKAKLSLANRPARFPAHTAMITIEEPCHLHDLYHAFGISSLGEGDPIAGANLLVAMASALAALQKPGCCLMDSLGSTIGVGTSLIVTGPLSVALVDEKILSGMALRQDNLAHLLRREHSKNRGTMDGCCLHPVTSPDFGESLRESFVENPSLPSILLDQNTERLMGLLLRDPSPSTLLDLRERPAVFVRGSKPAQLAKQLNQSHLGRPFVNARIDELGDFARLGGIVAAVTGGRGTTIITDPDGLLSDVLRTGPPATNWASRTIWLGDGQAGIESSENRGGSGSVLDAIQSRFNIAMDIAWGSRIGNLSHAAEVRVEFSEGQMRWIEFLRKLEPSFSGITGTARNLHATLLFGLQALVGAVNVPSGFKLQVEQVGALAKWVVERMILVQGEVKRLAESVRRQRLEVSVILKLGDGPLCARDLVRKFHALPTEECFGVLHDLQAAGRVHHSGGRWRLIKVPEHAPYDSRQPVYDV